MRQSRRGFTLIELLVVIGIIMLLVAILAYSFRSLNRTAANNETKAELKVCSGMLTEYEGRNGLQGIEYMDLAPQATDPGAPFGGVKRFPVYPDPDNFPPNDPAERSWTFGGPHNPPWPAIAFTDVSNAGPPPNGDMGDKSGGGGRYLPAVQRTLDVMYVLMRIPANQTHMQAVQPKRQLEQWPKATSPNTIQQGNVLLDGWGNPIIFVPRGGLHVYIKDANGTPQPYIVRSNGIQPVTGSQDPPLAGNERPFFASAGQDGDFTQGEDNVYSFQE